MDRSFDSFLENVLTKTEQILKEKGIHISQASLNKRLGLPESCKCIVVSSKKNIYYRIGKIKPRKGPHKGEELLVIDLVMDGYKRQVFAPILQRKDVIEEKIGKILERELPKTEATGQYRLKLMLSNNAFYEGKVNYTANMLADFIQATTPYLYELGAI